MKAMNDEKLIMGMMAKLPSVEERELLATLWLEHSERKELTVKPAVSASCLRNPNETQQSLVFGEPDDLIEQFAITDIGSRTGGVFRMRERKGRGGSDGISFDDRVCSGRVRLYVGRMYFGDAVVNVFAYKLLYGSPESRREQAASLREAIVQRGGINVFALEIARKHGLVK